MKPTLSRLLSILILVFILVSLVVITPLEHVKAQTLSLPAEINKSFSPVSIPVGGVSSLSVTIYNPNAFALSLSAIPAAWSDTLPTGVSFASPANITNSCGGTVATIGSTLSLSGGTVPAQVGTTPGSCTVTVKVTSISSGNHINTIAASSLKSTDPTGTILVTNTSPASATLQVSTVQPPSLSKSFNPNTQWVGQTSQLAINIRNNDLTYSLTETTLTDKLPVNVVVAATPGVSFSNCGTPTLTDSSGNSFEGGDIGLTLHNATIPANSTCVVKVNVTSAVAGVYNNTILAGAISTRQAVTNASAAAAPINFQAIGMSKSFSPSNFEVGGTSTMTIRLQNPSASPYTAVGFTDTLPSGLVISGTPVESQCGGTVTAPDPGKLVLAGGTIPAGTTSNPGTCTITATVTSNIPASYTNVIAPGALSTAEGATNVVAATANISVYGDGLGVTGSKAFSPSTIAVNGIAISTISIKAPADTNLTNFSITDALPLGVSVAADPVPALPAIQKNAACQGGTFNPQPGDTLITYTGATIPAGQTCTLNVNVTSSDKGVYINTISPANISNAEGRNVASNFSATLTVSGISVSKMFYPSIVNVDGISTLTITLTNTNTSQLENVSFSDTLTSTLPYGVVVADTPNKHTTCTSGEVGADSGSNVITLSGGIIPAQVGSVPGICTVSVDVKGVANGSYQNRINAHAVTGTIQGTETVVDNPLQATAGLTVAPLTIDVVKNFDPITVFGGSSATLMITLKNPNNTQLTGIAFTDTLPVSTDPENPGEMTIANPANPSTGTCGGELVAIPGAGEFSYSGGSLNANQTCVITVQTTMNVNGNLINTIPAGGVTTNNGAKNMQAAAATLTNLAGASLHKAFLTNPLSGSTGNVSTLQITIQNTSNVALSGLGYTDTLPAGLSVSSTPESSQCNGGSLVTSEDSITLTGGSLAAFDSCTLNVDVQASAPGSYENCMVAGTLISDQEATNTEDACDTLVVEEVLTPPAMTKSFSPNPVIKGKTSGLTFTISNPNNVALTGVAFEDTFPTGLVRASVPNASQCGGTVSSTLDSITLEGGTIPAKGSCTVVVGVTAANGGEYLNTSGKVTSTNGGEGNAASAALTVIAPPQIAKAFSPDTIPAGGSSTLTFTITNPDENTVGLTGVSFSDTFPIGLVRATAPESAQCGGTVTSTDTSVSLSGGSIDAGGSCTVSVEVSAANGGTYVNKSGAVNSANGGAGNSATATLTVQGVGLSLQKTTTSPNFKAAGDSITYQYQLTNTGDAVLYSPFEISDDHIGTPLGTRLVCDDAAVTSLDPGQSTTCSLSYQVSADDVTAKSVTNTATAYAMDEAENSVTSNPSSVTVKLAALTLDKTTTSVSYLAENNTLSYTYSLTNTGKVTLYGPFEVSDDHIGSPLGTPFTCGTATVLPMGGVTSCSKIYTIRAADLTDGSVKNTAIATAKDALSDGNTVTSNQDSVTVYKMVAPSVSKSFSPSSITVGGISTLTFTISNPNAMAFLSGVGLVDNLPTNLVPVVTPLASQCGGTVSYDLANNRITLTNGSIIPGGSCTVNVNVTSSVPGDYHNVTNQVTSTNGGNGNTASATLSVVAPAEISKAFSPDNITEGDVSTLTFTLTNPASNTVSLSGVSFTDQFPDGLVVADTPNASLSGCGSSDFTPAKGDGQLSFSNGTIAVGGSCVVKVDVTAPSGSYLNTTQAVSSANGGTGISSNTASLVVNAALDLAVTKTDGIKSADRGEGVEYTIEVSNSGPSDAAGARVMDNLPSSLVGVTWTCTAEEGAACSAEGSGSIDDSVDIPSGKKITYTVKAAVSGSAGTDIVNTVSVVPPAGLIDRDLTNNTQTDTDHLNGLKIEKEVSATHENYLVLGETVTYTYTLTNTGTSTLSTPFMVSDDHIGDPAGTAFSCGSESELLPDAKTSCTATYVITQQDLDVGSLTNTAYATAQDEDGDTVKSDTVDQTIGADQLPGIGAAKRVVSIEKVSTGTYDVTLEIAVKNYGNVTLHDVQITDNLATTFPAPTTYSVETVSSATLDVNTAFDGATDQTLLSAGNTLEPGETNTLTLVLQVIPTTHYYLNSAVASALSPSDVQTTDLSQDGGNPDPAGTNDPTNQNDPTPIDFGAHVFDPPYGKKTYDDSGRPLLHWTMVWINNTNIVGLHAVVHDPIPEKTTFTPNLVESGYEVPADAPKGSTSLGVSCTSSKQTVTTLCYYEGPTPEHLLGQIIWEGTIGPDFGVTDPEAALNAITISFNVTVEGNTTVVNNTATMDVDRNGDGDTLDEGEADAVNIEKLWDVTPQVLPLTGFAPGVFTDIGIQPGNLSYQGMNGLLLEIPYLGISTPILGVPSSNSGWDITWLGSNAGWLNGTAYPSWPGNSVITGHVTLPNGNPGPFAGLKNLRWGDRIVIHLAGHEYIYEVREVKRVKPEDLSILKHEAYSWLTLVTCQEFDQATQTYLYREVVRAVLVSSK